MRLYDLFLNKLSDIIKLPKNQRENGVTRWYLLPSGRGGIGAGGFLLGRSYSTLVHSTCISLKP